MNNKTILITGCVGFIGFHLVNRLCSTYNILGIDNLNNYYDVNLKKDRLNLLLKIKNFSFYRLDIRDKIKLDDFFNTNKVDIIIHLAAQAGVRYSLENPHTYIDNNVVGFLNILESCRKYKISKIIYASSSSVYGNENNTPFKENQQTRSPVSIYGVSKKTNELMAYSYSNLFDLYTIGLRFFTVYGPYGRPDMSYFNFTKEIINNKKVQLFNYGKHSRSFTYIDDVVESIFKIVEKCHDKLPFKNMIFNIGGSQSVNLIDYLKCFEKALNKKAIIEYLPFQKGDVKETNSDTKLLESFVNFKPEISIDVGIPKFISWYKNYYN